MTSDENPTNSRLSLSLALAKRHARSVVIRLVHMPLYAKCILASVIIFYGALLAFIVIMTPARIGQFVYDTGQKISGHPLGWTVLAGLLLIVSFPPMIGHTTVLNLCGFAYGIKGFAIAGPGSLFASALVFVILRFFFSKRLAKWSASNEHWQALETVIKVKGLPLMALIRMSPFPPWVYSNSLFASIRSVSVWKFMLATLCTFPRYFLYVFIGSRLALLADGNHRDKMDTTTKVINGVLVGGGILVGALAGWVVYTLMQRQLKQISSSASEAIFEADEGAPLLDGSEDEV